MLILDVHFSGCVTPKKDVTPLTMRAGWSPILIPKRGFCARDAQL